MRALVVGGGCRGLDLARALTAEGHAVRMVTRRPEARAAIEAAGAECFAGDPDVVGTLRYALDGVTILLWLLGTASGPADKVAALHGSRLRMMLSKTTDTTVRGVVYEAAGTVGAEVLAAGVEEMRHARRDERDPLRAARDGPRGRRRVGRGGARRDRRAAHCSSIGGGLTSGAPGRAHGAGSVRRSSTARVIATSAATTATRSSTTTIALADARPDAARAAG